MISLLRTVVDRQGVAPVGLLDDDMIRWVVETGLGPLLLRATTHRPQAERPRLGSLLQAADLTARVIAAEQLDAMTEIIDACRGEVPPLVLLKGISICEQYYPEPHLRPMRDIDFLVEPDAIPRIGSILAKLGYGQPVQRSPAFYDTHHHSSPFFHPQTGVWVDVHRALVAPTSELCSDEIFGAESLRTQLRASEFRGRPVRRLSNELQLVHLSCHWAHRLQIVGGMVAMMDMTCLLTHARGVQWPRILQWTAGSVASRYLHLLLTYLTRRRLVDVDPDLLRRLRGSQSALDHLTLQLAHALLDRYVVDGRDFGWFTSETTLRRVWRALVLRRSLSRSAGERHHQAKGGDPRDSSRVRAPRTIR